MPRQHRRKNSWGPTHPKIMKQTTLYQHRHTGKQSNLSRLNHLGLGLPREFLGPENMYTPWAWAAFSIPSWLMVLIDWNCQAELPSRIFLQSWFCLCNDKYKTQCQKRKWEAELQERKLTGSEDCEMMNDEALRGGITCDYLCLVQVSAEDASRNKSIQVSETAFGTYF